MASEQHESGRAAARERPEDNAGAEAHEILDPAALETLRELVGGDDAVMAELIDSFLEDAPQLLANLRQALAEGNAAGVRLAAHTLKSNSADFGATTLFRLCKELEAMGKAGALDGAADLVTQAEAEYEKVIVALEAVRGQ